MDASTYRDKAVAKYLNEHFYAVKMDAETKDSLHFQGKHMASNLNTDRTNLLPSC